MKDKEKKLLNIKHEITVTMEVTYLIPHYDTSNINELMKEWFEDTPLSASHVYRNNCKLGFSEKVINININ